MIVFGGSHALATATCDAGPTDTSNETWIYSEACDAWKQAMASGPGRRVRHVAAYGSGKMWVFGGRNRDQGASSGAYTVYDELWAFDVASSTWDAVAFETEAPRSRYSAAMAWDSTRNRLWLFGGNTAPDGVSLSLLNDVWSYQPETNVWREAETTGDIPVGRQWHGMVFDASRDRLVVHGGVDPSFGYLTDTIALDLETRTWERLDDGGAEAPSERFWGSLVYRDQQRDYLWFGGHDNTNLGNKNDLYRFDPETNVWHRLFEGDTWNKPGNALCDFPPDFATIAPNSPERRHAAGLIWSNACERLLLFGGKTDCGIVDDLWSYAGDGWQKLQQATEGEVCYRWRDDPDRCTSLCQ
jgi:N-acetylneuraminic acid mutarotase